MMKRAIPAVGVLALLVAAMGAAGCNGGGMRGGAGDPAIAAPVPDGRPAGAVMDEMNRKFRWDEFEQMIVVLGLGPSQEQAFRENMLQRSEQLEALAAKHEDVRRDAPGKMEDLRRVVMGPLSAAQRRYWARYVAYRGLYRGLGRLDLTGAQKDELWELAGGAAEDLMAADYVATDPYLSKESTKARMAALRAKAEKEVLTPAQQAKIAG